MSTSGPFLTFSTSGGGTIPGAVACFLSSSTGRGYIVVGADGGAFSFGSGARIHGSLPGEGIRAADIVGIALSPDNDGYLMAGSDGRVYGFGDAQAAGVPAGVASNLPVAAIAGT